MRLKANSSKSEMINVSLGDKRPEERVHNSSLLAIGHESIGSIFVTW